VHRVGDQTKVRNNKLNYIVESRWLCSQLYHDARTVSVNITPTCHNVKLYAHYVPFYFFIPSN